MSEAPRTRGAEGLLARQSPMWCGTAMCKCSDGASVYKAKARAVNPVFPMGGRVRWNPSLHHLLTQCWTLFIKKYQHLLDLVMIL